MRHAHVPRDKVALHVELKSLKRQRKAEELRTPRSFLLSLRLSLKAL